MSCIYSTVSYDFDISTGILNESPAQPPVTGRCARPGLPPKAQLWLISPERSRFDNKEKVLVHCKKDEFPQFKQELECRNGEHVDSQVIHLDVYDCQSPDNRLLLSQAINRSWESPPEVPLRSNSYHLQRVPVELTISAKESTCYTWRIQFEHKVNVAFLLIDINFPEHNNTGSHTNNSTAYLPTVKPIVSRYRTCSLQKAKRQAMGGDVVVGYYYFCDLNSESDAKAEQSALMDTITVHVNTSVPHEVGLEAVFLGRVFTTSIGGGKIVRPDCGQFEVKNIGVDFQAEAGHTFISCNDSYVDISQDRYASKKVSVLSGNPQ
ncbi:unnamed protein product [Oppiella nova]|uniref:Uncharacterized protein n=1 Tax=Oppiella nova TaxID=334625 RepID=A0A7R9LYC7_9ACAR|nr:unnamed protein product [Oppiella nova]CAG2168108.1 unnamed protein product [Oppiella nova]